MRKLRLFLTWLSILLLGLTLPVAAAAADGFFVSTTVVQTKAEVDAFWTPERVAQALANPKDLAKGGSGPLLGLSAEEPTGPPLSSPGYCPDCADYPDAAAAPPIKLGATCPASPYDWSYDSDYGSYPQRVIGKVIFQSPSGELGSCSAALVEKRLILTAGHCVSENGAWMTSVVFKPGYLDGNSPFGDGHSEWITTPGEWLHLELPTRDVAFVRISESMGETLGWLGLKADWGRSGTTWQQYGYPADAPFDGSKLTKNTSAWGYDDCTSGPPCTMGVGNPFTGGSSGGPWVLNLDGEHYANGVNSYYYQSCESTMHSPYFDRTIWDLFQSAKATQ